MATFKHISSKNADYGAAEAYLTFEHDEFTMKPTLDENGRLIPREDYRISSLNCGGEDFAVACMRANLRYEKNQKREDEGVFTIDEVQEELQMLFEKQYILTQTVEVEVRYRTETRTDSEGNDYDVEVPYNYYICKVKLENFDLSHVPVYIMDEETLSLYAVYMATLGNREDLFPGSGYVDKYTKPPTTYDIPPSALEDETFATLITEAEKYIGYPYVWGGSNPSTSFDCSGFVSWALTQSGVCNTGRLGAQGLYNISTPVSSANARPGDLIFFVGTYDTPGVSHVGIYVGGGKMLHCGDPIQYADINTSYWQSHFYAFGRPPYN